MVSYQRFRSGRDCKERQSMHRRYCDKRKAWPPAIIGGMAGSIGGAISHHPMPTRLAFRSGAGHGPPP